jgi:hypothetical protein
VRVEPHLASLTQSPVGLAHWFSATGPLGHDGLIHYVETGCLTPHFDPTGITATVSVDSNAPDAAQYEGERSRHFSIVTQDRDSEFAISRVTPFHLLRGSGPPADVRLTVKAEIAGRSLTLVREMSLE